MASAFWTLEDGRGFARRWSGMANMLKLITDELKHIEEAEAFYNYLKPFIYREEEGDSPNGYGGFIRNNESVMFNFDMRSFAPENRNYFWQSAKSALSKLIAQADDKNQSPIRLLTTLLDMHKRIEKGEDPKELNHMDIKPAPEEKLGPGW